MQYTKSDFTTPHHYLNLVAVESVLSAFFRLWTDVSILSIDDGASVGEARNVCCPLFIFVGTFMFRDQILNTLSTG